MRLEGQTALVTGASRGLGRSIALALAEEGALVALVARDDEALRVVARQIEQIGGVALPIQCDVRDPVAVQSLARQAHDTWGAVDTLVNGAAVAPRTPILEILPEKWDDIFATMVRGAMLVTQALLRPMITRRRGNIINLVAPSELLMLPDLAAYGAATSAVAGMTRALAAELRPFGINVNGLHPGGLADTNLLRPVLQQHDSPPTETHWLDPAIITPAAIALAAQPTAGLSGEILDALVWNSGFGLGAGLS